MNRRKIIILIILIILFVSGIIILTCQKKPPIQEINTTPHQTTPTGIVALEPTPTTTPENTTTNTQKPEDTPIETPHIVPTMPPQIETPFTCTHIFSNWEIVEPASCEQTGKKTRYCKICNKIEVSTINKTGHQLTDWVTSKKATCTTTGTETRHCKLCSYCETKNIPATGHNFSAWKAIKQMTCESDGKQERTCSNCGKKEEKTMLHSGHNYSLQQSLVATISKPSEKIYKCANCGKTYSDYGELLRGNIGGNYKCGEDLLEKGLPHSWDCNYMDNMLTKIKTYPKNETQYLYGDEIYGLTTQTARRAYDEYMYVALEYDCTWRFSGRYGYGQFGMRHSANEDSAKAAFEFARKTIKNLGITKNTLQRDAIEIINNFICEQKAYNYDYERDCSLYASLTRNVGVCHNYACEFQLLCLAAGIECYYYSAIDMNHSWNKVVFPDGKWYWVDVCWNDARVAGSSGTAVEALAKNGISENTIRRLRNKYLLITTEELLKDHQL